MSWLTIHNEKELLARIAEGDAGAFNIMYNASSEQLYNAVVTLVNSVPVAEDIVQSAYLKVWEHRERIALVRDFGDYLFIIARNASFDYLRNSVNRQRILQLLSSTGGQDENPVEEDFDDRETRKIFERAIAELPPQQYRAYKLQMEQEMSLAEIAQHMEITSSTVKTHLELARKFVRSYMRNHLDILFILVLLSLL